jgi:hypothetical protein
MEKNPSRTESENRAGLKPYEPPQVVVVDEKEMLKVFQVTSAGSSWWG